jgi:hypothetical protein
LRITSSTVDDDVLAPRHLLQWDGDDGGAMQDLTSKRSAKERDIINVASEGWQWPAEEPPRSDKLSEPRVDEAEKQRWRELAAEEWRKAHAPSAEEVLAVEVLSPEENRVIEAFKQEVRAAEEFEDKKRRARARFDANLQHAFGDLVPKLKRAYGQPARDEADARTQHVLALLAIAHFLEQMGPDYLAHFADQFATLAQALQDLEAGIRSPVLTPASVNRSDPTLVWIARAYVALAVKRLCKRGYTRKAAAEWIAERYPELRQLITEETAWDAKRSQSLTTAIISWSRNFDRRGGVKIKNHFAVEVYSRGLKELEAARDCNDDEIEALLQEALRMCSWT